MKYRCTGALLGIAAVIVIVAGCGGSKKLSKEQIIAKASKSTIEISGKGKEGEFGGTGVIIESDGLALTNAHVVTGLSALKAKVNDETEVPIKVVATNPCEDIALVKLATVPQGAEPMTLGKSSELKAGQEVNALGYPQSATDPGKESVVATSGAINVVNTSSGISPMLNKFPSLIQHQAQINPGNSGGPLVNDKAELVGINTLGTNANVAQGQSYAIPIDHIKQLLPELKTGKNTNYMGWRIEPISTEIIKQYFSETQLSNAVIDFVNSENLASTLFVTGVDPGSPADKGKVEEGDLIVKLNDTEVNTVGDVCDILQSTQSGSTIKITGRYLADATSIAQIGDVWVESTKIR